MRQEWITAIGKLGIRTEGKNLFIGNRRLRRAARLTWTSQRVENTYEAKTHQQQR